MMSIRRVTNRQPRSDACRTEQVESRSEIGRAESKIGRAESRIGSSKIGRAECRIVATTTSILQMTPTTHSRDFWQNGASDAARPKRQLEHGRIMLIRCSRSLADYARHLSSAAKIGRNMSMSSMEAPSDTATPCSLCCPCVRTSCADRSGGR